MDLLMTLSYLIDRKYINREKENFKLACLCLDYLTFDCFDIQLSKQSIQKYIANGSYAFHEYAIAHWIHHLDSYVQVAKDIDRKSIDDLEQILRDFVRSRWPNTWIQNTRCSKEARKDYHIFSTSVIFENLLQVVTKARNQEAGAFRSFVNQDNEIQLATQLELVRTNFEELVASLSPTNSLRELFQKYYGQSWFKCVHIGCVYFYKGFPNPTDRDHHTSKHTRAFLCTFSGCHVAITGCKTANELANHVSEFHPTSQDGTHTFPSSKTMSFSEAVSVGRLDDVEPFLQNLDFGAWQIGRSKLLNAAYCGHDAVLLRLLEIYDCNGDDYLKFLRSAIIGRKESTTIMLLMGKEKHIQPQKNAEVIDKLLMPAASVGLEGVVKVLLENRRHPTKRRSKERSAICLAAENGHKVVVKQLLDSNQLDLRQINPGQPTPLFCAARHGHETIVQVLLQYPECVATNERDIFWLGVAQLFNGARKGDNDLVRLLLARKDVPPNYQTRSGYTPLIFASEKGHATIVKLLLEHKDIRPNMRTFQKKMSALSYAARHGHESVVKLLLAQDDIDTTRGKGTRLRNGHIKEFGFPPSEEASRHGHHSIVALLSEHASNHPRSVSPRSRDKIDLPETDDQTERISAIDDSVATPRQDELLPKFFDVNVLLPTLLDPDEPSQPSLSDPDDPPYSLDDWFRPDWFRSPPPTPSSQ